MSTQQDQTLHLPRLLCLHGGGVSGSIFRMQMRAVYAQLSHTFRFVYADAPWLCDPGPGILPVFAGCGPYRRWLRYLSHEHPEVDDDTATEEVEYSLRSAMEEDDARGADGEWVGLVGFSQGATISLSILFDRQVRLERHSKQKMQASHTNNQNLDGMYGGFDTSPTTTSTSSQFSYIPEDQSLPLGIASGRWRFAIALAGRAGLVKISPLLESHDALISAAKISQGPFEYDRISVDEDGGLVRMLGDGVKPNGGSAGVESAVRPGPGKKVILMEDNESRIWMPTLHVHGLLDPGLTLHRKMVEFYCTKAGGKDNRNGPGVVEWEGDHRVPLKTQDAIKVAEGVMSTAKRAGVFSADAHFTPG